jgi:hypothetical protein
MLIAQNLYLILGLMENINKSHVKCCIETSQFFKGTIYRIVTALKFINMVTAQTSGVISETLNTMKILTASNFVERVTKQIILNL